MHKKQNISEKNSEFLQNIGMKFVLSWTKHSFNPLATGDAYMRFMRQPFHCLQWYAGSERVNIYFSPIETKIVWNGGNQNLTANSNHGQVQSKIKTNTKSFISHKQLLTKIFGQVFSNS